MAENVTLTNLVNLTNEPTAVAAINNNNSAITTAFTDVLSRSGTAPNSMGANLDMNNNQIINLPSPATVNSPVRLIDVASNPTIVVPPTGTSGATVPFLNGNNTWSGTNTFNAASTFSGASTFSSSATFNSSSVFNVAPTFNTSLTIGQPVTFTGSVDFTGSVTLPSTPVVNSLGYAVTTFTGPTSQTLSSSNLNETIFCDATSGGVTLTLPTASAFGTGMVAIKKIDLTSNLVSVYPPSGNIESGFSFYPLSLENDSLILQSDGVSSWKLVGQNFSNLRHNIVHAEHTITSATYNIDQTYCGYIMLVSTSSVGAPVLMELPLISAAAKNHQTFTVGVMNFDGTYEVSIVSQSGDTITDPRASPSGSSYVVNLAAGFPNRCYWFWTDGARWVIPMTNGV